MIKQLPIPDFFNRQNAFDDLYQPVITSIDPKVFTIPKAALDWRKQHDIKSSGGDKLKVHLLLIDLQIDFCFPSGSLFVAGQSGKGAMEDNARIAEFIYKNLGVITDITTTMDTHFPHQIFYGSFWKAPDGSPLNAHSMIVVDDDGQTLLNVTPGMDLIHKGVLPDPAITDWLGKDYTWLCKQALYYNQQLAKGVPGRANKYVLYIWPEHCMLGGLGHNLTGVIQEARLFHSYVRMAKDLVEVKGGNHLSENYSVFAMEVLTRWDGKSLGQKNTRFIQTIMDADVVIIAGQAKSHCVAWTIADLLFEIKAKDEELAKKIYLLGDCTSSVVIPGVVDFTEPAEKAFQSFVDADMNLVDSTDLIVSWPGISL